MRILLVEPHADTSRLMVIALGRMGHVVRATATAAEALWACAAAAAAGTFDVLLTGIGLPDADGCDLLGAVRERQGAICAVALTAHAMPDDVARYRRAGFDACVLKPVELPALRDVLDAVCHKGDVAAGGNVGEARA